MDKISDGDSYLFHGEIALQSFLLSKISMYSGESITWWAAETDSLTVATPLGTKYILEFENYSTSYRLSTFS